MTKRRESAGSRRGPVDPSGRGRARGAGLWGAATLLLTMGSGGCGGEFDRDTPTTAVMNGGDWRDEVIYQLVVDRFSDGDINNNHRVDNRVLGRYQGGDWQGVVNNLDYLQALGVTTLWISPVVKNVDYDAGFDAYHGYWTQDFETLNPHFGSPAKLRELVARAHEKKIKVILDIVTNHMGQLFYYDINGNGQPDTIFLGSNSRDKQLGTAVDTDGLAQLLRYDEFDPDFDPRTVQGFSQLGSSGAATPRFLYMPEINRVPPPPIRFGDSDKDVLDFRFPGAFHRTGRVTNYDAMDQLTTGDFPGGLKDLATEQKVVQQGLIKAFAKLIYDYDFDGFRIDTLKHVDHGFWQAFGPAIREYAHGKRTIWGVPPLTQPKKNWFMFGEAFDGDDNLLGEYTYNNEVDSVFYFSQKFQVYEDVVKCGGGTAKVDALWNNRLRWNAATAATHGPTRGCFPGRCFRSTTGVNGDGSPKGGLVPDPANGQPIFNQSPVDLGPVDTQGVGVPPSKLLVNFLDNHDVARFLSPIVVCGKDQSLANEQIYGQSTLYRELLRQRLHSALGLMFAQDGLPCLYYGTEQEFEGGNDPANRERLFGSLVRNAYTSQASAQREPLWGSGYGRSAESFKWIAKLTGVRKKYEVLRRGDLRVTWSSERTGGEADANVLAFVRTLGDKAALVVANYKDPSIQGGALSTTDAPKETSFNGQGMVLNVPALPPGTTLVDVLADPYDKTGESTYKVGNDGKVIVRVSPRATKILVPEAQVQP